MWGKTGRQALITQAQLLAELDDVAAGGGAVLYSRDRPDADPSPLAFQTFSRMVEMKAPFQLLVEPHPEVKSAPEDLTSLMLGAVVGNAELVEDLASRGADLEAMTRERMTALMLAANAGHRDAVRVLVAAGARVDARGEQESTALMFAAQHGHDAVVRILLDAGAEVNARGSHGLTALGFARQNRRGSTSKILERAGAVS